VAGRADPQGSIQVLVEAGRRALEWKRRHPAVLDPLQPVACTRTEPDASFAVLDDRPDDVGNQAIPDPIRFQPVLVEPGEPSARRPEPQATRTILEHREHARVLEIVADRGHPPRGEAHDAAVPRSHPEASLPVFEQGEHATRKPVLTEWCLEPVLVQGLEAVIARNPQGAATIFEHAPDRPILPTDRLGPGPRNPVQPAAIGTDP
jgi:hypothetical protein